MRNIIEVKLGGPGQIADIRHVKDNGIFAQGTGRGSDAGFRDQY